MLKRRVVPILLLASIVPAALAPALAAPGAGLPHRFNPGLDGAPVFAADASSGALWAAWSYRSRGEYDLAVSVRGPDGVWSEPAFVGRLDGLDQVAPALVSDASGNLYLAFAVRQTSQVLLSVLRGGAASWSAPLAVTAAGQRGLAPALSIVADRLVLGYRTGDGKVVLRDLPLLIDPIASQGIYDNPDGTDPLGVTGGGSSGGSSVGPATDSTKKP